MTPPLLYPRLEPPWLIAELGTSLRVLSFAPYRSGFVMADRIVWRELRNADLPVDLAVSDWVTAEMTEAGHAEAVGMLTSRDVTKFQRKETRVESARVAAIATVGLGNAERIGTRTPRDWSFERYGTINIAVQIAEGLTEAAQIEALSIATQARTAAVVDAGLRLPHGPVTGTGTDCIAIAAPKGDTAYAGLHTALGEAIGAAVYQTVATGAAVWIKENPEMMRNVFGA
ncbi:adenosylcobinamide amidohydrolase [Celeribacter halophilus]|uniref:adenosylcobinamide amidohydrolase n=1 Tax=Celeribacter halophilus TaxID=576117 RepID=UPI003A903F86